MLTLLADLAVMLLVAAVAISFGWLARAVTARRMVAAEPDDGRDEAHRAREALARLHELAARVAADVGQHSHRVEAINEELQAAEVLEPETVVKAITNLVQANNQMQQKLASAEGKLQEQGRQIQTHVTAARTDALTGLANRRAFDEEIARRYAEFQRHGRTFSVLMADVDHFKKFNDSHGHQAGDEVLRGVARVLRQSSRETDMVARYGGEEFAVIFPGSLVADAKAQVERLRKAIEKTPFPFGGAELHVTASLGIAHLLIDEMTAGLVQRADAALYASKEAGRNCAHWHDGQAIHPITAEEPPDLPEIRETPRRDPRPEALPPKQAKAPPEPPDALKPRSKPADEAAEAKSEAEAFVPKPVDGLYNRTEFCVVLGRRLAEWRRSGRPVSVLLVQVDRFGEIAARHGPQAAQLALRATSQFLNAAIREMDVAAQYDNNTFALFLPEVPGAAALEVAERLRQAISRCRLPLGAAAETITVSVGGTEAAQGDDLQRLLGRTEEALDMARITGGNRAYFHTGRSAEPASVVLGVGRA